jgi:FkbM family methyltransferase
MGLSEFLLAQIDRPFTRKALRWANHLLRPPGPVPVRVRNQKIYAASLDRLLALLLLKFGNAERFEIDLWQQHLRPGMVAVDIGANLGLYTLLAAERIGPGGTVHAFEPAPHNYALLCRNVKVNGHTNVVLHEIAVADREGTVPLHLCPEHHGDHRIYHVAHGNRPTINVRLTTLDAALHDAPRVDLVKMDIQGSEWRAVEGMRGLIERNPRMLLFLEFWPKGLRESGAEPADFLRRLRELGFLVRHINSKRRTLEEWDDRELVVLSERHGYTNLLASRQAV